MNMYQSLLTFYSQTYVEVLFSLYLVIFFWSRTIYVIWIKCYSECCSQYSLSFQYIPCILEDLKDFHMEEKYKLSEM